MSKLPSDIEKFLGSKTIEAMHRTKWWAFARIIDHCLYYGGIEDKTKNIHGMPAIGLPGVEGQTVDLRRAMRELQHDCEMMALKEVT